MRADPGSYRDPRGQVLLADDRVFRLIRESGVGDFKYVQSTGLLERLVSTGRLVEYSIVNDHESGVSKVGNREILLEHPRLPFISYPYEWGFEQLKAAALLHIEICLEALELDVMVADASAYNIQFVGFRPVFIDHLSFRAYRDGEYWVAHRQFCEQFLNPLLLRSKIGITHNAWYRGSIEGISVTDLNRMMPWYRKLSWNMFTQITLQAYFQEKSKRNQLTASGTQMRPLPKQSLKNLYMQIRRWTESLAPAKSVKTTWANYAIDNAYEKETKTHKRDIVFEFCRRVQAHEVWDIGCNTGEYSLVALDSGVRGVVGFDFDLDAVDQAYLTAGSNRLNFLPILMDASNPSPDQGWQQRERSGLSGRGNPDAILALALVHHLAIGRNIPLDSVANWLVSISNSGLVEFVPKDDPMVQVLLMHREDIFLDYSIDNFKNCLEQEGVVVREMPLRASNRVLLEYQPGQ